MDSLGNLQRDLRYVMLKMHPANRVFALYGATDWYDEGLSKLEFRPRRRPESTTGASSAAIFEHTNELQLGLKTEKG